MKLHLKSTTYGGVELKERELWKGGKRGGRNGGRSWGGEGRGGGDHIASCVGNMAILYRTAIVGLTPASLRFGNNCKQH